MEGIDQWDRQYAFPAARGRWSGGDAHAGVRLFSVRGVLAMGGALIASQLWVALEFVGTLPR